MDDARQMEPLLNLVYDAMAALENLTGLPFPALAGIVVAVAILLGLVAGRRMFRSPAAPPQEKQEPVQQLTTDRATLDPENPALTGYRQLLESRGVPATEQHTLIRAYASQLEEVRQRLDEAMENSTPDDDDLEARLSPARTALAAGDLEQAVGVLVDLGDTEMDAGRALRRQSEQRLMSATLARIVAGDLEMAAQNAATAGEHYAQAVESVPPGNDALLAECLNKHGTAMFRSRNPDAGAISFRRAVKLIERVKGESHPDVATALNNLAMLYYAKGEYAAAEPLYERALGIDEQALGREATAVATDLNNLALLYKKQDRMQEAEPLMKRSLEIKSKHFDPGHPSLVTGLRNYAGMLRALGRDEEAESFDARADALPPKRRPEGADG